MTTVYAEATSRPAALATDVPFTPALPENQRKRPGVGLLQPGGLVVHTGWSLPPYGEEQILRQHRACEDFQSWCISTPDGHRAARFQYLTREHAAAAAAAIAAALPNGVWPDHPTDPELLERALEASSGPEMLPRVHRGKPDWGRGCVTVHWTMPTTRAAYERMIAAHGGAAPKSCRTCADIRRRWNGTDWLPRTGHWPRWNPEQAHARGRLCRAHCPCMTCLGPVAIGTLGTAVDETGQTVPGSLATHTGSLLPDFTDREVPYDQRPFAFKDVQDIKLLLDMDAIVSLLAPEARDSLVRRQPRSRSFGQAGYSDGEFKRLLADRIDRRLAARPPLPPLMQHRLASRRAEITAFLSRSTSTPETA
ncbi:hypothetical protein [Streptomyces sp. NPDC056682]|uniref:hypothetical protein n=1 Tax=Streptomyces sp. NPDC056682 TaxID=3345909 RepID=UPI00369B8360